MRVLKILGIIISLVIIVLSIALALTLPEKYLERSIVMNASPEAIYEEVNTFKSFSQWSPMLALDPQEQLSFEGPDSGPGARVRWAGKKTGKGSEYIVVSEANRHVKNRLEFDGLNGVFYSDFDLQPVSDGTKVTWSYHADFSGTSILNRAKGKFLHWFADKRIGKLYETGLTSLKRIVEAKPVFSVKITEENVSPILYVGEQCTIALDDPKAVDNAMNTVCGEIKAFMKKMKIEQAGAPMCIYLRYSDSSAEMIWGIPVKNDITISHSKFKISRTTSSKVVKAIHKGAHDTLRDTHRQILRYLGYKRLPVTGPSWERYVTDSSTEKDTARWITEVCYPID